MENKTDLVSASKRYKTDLMIFQTILNEFAQISKAAFIAILIEIILIEIRFKKYYS